MAVAVASNERTSVRTVHIMEAGRCLLVDNVYI